LAIFLRDPEWDVRAAALASLQRLRGAAFPQGDREVVRFALHRLGDENSLVAAAAVDLLEQVDDPSPLLLELLETGAARSEDRALEILRTVITLAGADDPGGTVNSTFDPLQWAWVLESPRADLRAEYLYMLGMVDLRDVQLWSFGLEDPDPGVRARALAGARLLSDPLPTALLEPLLRDPDEAVRIEALFTVGRAADLSRSAVAEATHDSSAQVRGYAVMLLEELVARDD
jgi:HEAT repeat protein